ncbi:hypothetical protein FRB99_000448 [Tulasnella sp. 403]|nr:hypothetical protein FRB99_000448 [Tulasnella sp. 403]
MTFTLATALLVSCSFAFLRGWASNSPADLARTPPMGWNTWNHFGCQISEKTVVDAAKALSDSGLKDFGYECWQAPTRHSLTKEPLADPQKFPSGIKSVVEQVHALGLKFGIYSDGGTHTCGGRFGSLGYEDIDAKTYAEWGVDFLKYDNCYNEGLSGNQSISHERYGNMSRALASTGRPIHFAVCNWGEDKPWEWASEIAQSWRISGDIYDNFGDYDPRCPCEVLEGCKNFGHHCAVTRILDWAASLVDYAGPGGWNDLDMLEVGNGNMTYDEYVTHFSMWALLKSPMILGNDLTKMTDETWEIITNKLLIDTNQDELGIPVRRRWRRPVPQGGTVQLWSGPLTSRRVVVAVMNTSPISINLQIPLSDVFEEATLGFYDVYDVWKKDTSGRWGAPYPVHSNNLKVSLRKHQTKVWILVPSNNVIDQVSFS